MLKVYIAGPITGMPDYNKPAFKRAENLWRKAGWDPINPIELDNGDHSNTFLWYMRRDIKLMMDCDAVALLPGWKESKGATIEYNLASSLGIPTYGAEHPAIYVQHEFIYPGNICCLKPDYVHESAWGNQ